MYILMRLPPLNRLLFQVLAIQHKLPELKTIIQILGEPPVAERRRLHRTHRKHIFSWAALIEVGQVGEFNH
jgi:hypothetical protein